jgi:acyl carrier protein
MKPEKLCALIESYCKNTQHKIGSGGITLETQFPDLGFDITDVSDLLVFIKDKTDISIPDTYAGDFFTPNDIYMFIEQQ